ncbi:MAG: hypothetical protein KGS61_15900 [Verrucomicrobia bacterium]|nr:hypothetical protein [Verrucomicrobiota bacterium]
MRFVIRDRQDGTVQAGIARHNLADKERWLTDGCNPAFDCWWHITEVTPDHFRTAEHTNF